MLLFCAVAFSREWAWGAPERKLDGSLAELAHLADTPAALADFCDRHPTLADPNAVQVVVEWRDETVDVASVSWPKSVQIEVESAEAVQLRVAAADLLRLAQLNGVHRVRQPWRPSPKAELSEGYHTVMVRDWQGDGLSGAGVRVGVIDVGFLDHEGLLGVELPDSVTTRFERGAADSSKHGAAVAEVIHDFAPQAELVLASFGTDLEFGQVLQVMLDEDVDLVNASIGFDNVWHSDGTSPLTRYANAAANAGVLFVGAAGNENERYRVGSLENEPDTSYVRLDGNYGSRIKAPGGTVRVSFRWSEVFGEASTDLDLIVVNPSDLSECGRSENPQDGDDYPYEEVIVTGCEEEVYAIAFTAENQDVSGLTGFLYSSYGMAEGQATGIQDLTLPADCDVCLAVGAYDEETGGAADYSSRGPSDDGRMKPDLVAPSDVITASVAEFSGSSAAAPHVSGLMALYLERTLQAGEPELATDWARAGARDLDAEGADYNTGYGLATGDTLPPEGCACGTTGTGAATWGIAAVMAAFLRRQTRRAPARGLLGAAALAIGGCVPDGLDGEFVVLHGAVVSETGAGIEGATVQFFTSEAEQVGEVVADESGRWSFPVLATEVSGNRIEATANAEGYSEGYGGWDVNILVDERVRLKAGPGTTWQGLNRNLAPLRLALSGDFARFTGRLVDAYGSSLGGVSLVVQPGWDAPVGAAVSASAVTESDGSFLVTVSPPGLYTVYAAPSEAHGGTRFPALATATGTEVIATVAPRQEPGQLFATLTWAGVANLDLHLTGPERDETGDGVESRLHLYSGHVVHPDYPVEGEGYTAELIAQSEDGPGPETARVNAALGVGLVHLSAFDQTNQFASGSPVLAESGALLQWWNGEDIPRYAWASPLETGTAWMPIKIDTRGGTAYAVESYAEQVDPTDEDAF